MKVFCSYAFTGEDTAAVESGMRLVVDTLEASGHDVYCNLFDKDIEQFATDDYKGILQDAFTHLATCDVVVAIVCSERRSVGQCMELGVALNDSKPIYLFEHESAKETSYLNSIADAHYLWASEDELRGRLEQV